MLIPRTLFATVLSLVTHSVTTHAQAAANHTGAEQRHAERALVALLLAVERSYQGEFADIEDLRTRDRLRALVPTLHVVGRLGTRGSWSARNADALTQNYSEGESWAVSVNASLALDRLVFAPSEAQFARERRRLQRELRTQQRGVIARFYAFMRLAPTLCPPLLPNDGQAATLQARELWAELDLLTDGAFSPMATSVVASRCGSGAENSSGRDGSERIAPIQNADQNADPNEPREACSSQARRNREETDEDELEDPRTSNETRVEQDARPLQRDAPARGGERWDARFATDQITQPTGHAARQATTRGRRHSYHQKG